ncbi:hypothetical protein LOCC1_G004811 [Lachnellula occidentalis]|uniref:Uncharacterized protein n=1 Tax=Lachnellula occidentalis TaxID=215460 RepID=A0A8H8RP66_9HELO|nr:hypothetical protein LOCC1_G004811 [Lachnellula occidentalis]
MATETPPPEAIAPLGLNDYAGEAAVESPAVNNGHQESFPANTSTLPTDYSDVPSNNSEDSGKQKQKQRRKYQRGGRKKGLQSVSESNLPDEGEVEADGVEQPRVKSSRRTSGKTKLKHRDSGSRPAFDTGIKAFNLKRAESSGGRPFGMSVEDPRSKSKAKPKLKHKAKSTRRKQKQQKEEEEEEEERKENWESQTSSEESESESESESEEEKDGNGKGKGKKKNKKEKEKKEEPKKPLSIRFDLNIELEIFLKAKIKGDITVTFLLIYIYAWRVSGQLMPGLAVSSAIFVNAKVIVSEDTKMRPVYWRNPS